MSTPASVDTDAGDIDACPHCGTTAGVRVTTDNPPKVRAWCCAACGTDWAVSVVNPRPYFDHLAATVELAVARSLLRQLVTLAGEASGLSDTELRARLLAFVGRLR